MSNARKLFRMLKFLIEYKNIKTLLGKAKDMKTHKFILALIPRVAFFNDEYMNIQCLTYSTWPNIFKSIFVCTAW